MSDTPEPTPPVDLSDLRMTPKWVADFGKDQPQFHTHEGESQDRPRRDRDRDGRGFGGGTDVDSVNGPQHSKEQQFYRLYDWRLSLR